MVRKRVATGRFSRAAVLTLAVLIGATAAATAAQSQAPAGRAALKHPLFQSWYDGRRNLVLAACSAGPITEQDLLLFRLMKRQSAPALFDSWENALRADERERLTKSLEDGLREVAYTLTLADRESERRPTAIDEKFIRYLKYPVYQWVWVERVLRPTVEIEELDLIKYYHDHAGQYYQPESVRVRYIFRQVPEAAPIAERTKIEEEMQAIRARALAGESFIDLARDSSDAPSAVRGGELPLVSRGMFVTEFENAAMALAPGEVSPVFWGPEGLYIVQCLEKFAERQVPFEKANEDLRKEVEHKTLQFLYDYELRKLIRRRDYHVYAYQYRELRAHEPLLVYRDYRLGKSEMLHMFPYVISDPVVLNARLLGGIVQDALQGEMIAQQVEAHGHGSDPLLLAADRMARDIWRSIEGIVAAQAVPLDFSEDEVRRYYQAHRQALGYQPMKRVYRITASVRNPYLRHPSQLEAMRGVLRSEFELVLQEFRLAFLEDRAAASQEAVLSEEVPLSVLDAGMIPEDAASTEGLRLRRRLEMPPPSLRVFAESSTADYQFEAQDYGFITPHNSLVWKLIADLEAGERTPLRSSAGELSCYFIERSIPGMALEYDKIRGHVRRQYIASLQVEALVRLREDLEKQAALRIRLPELSEEGN